MDDGETPLSVAAGKGHVKGVEALIKAGCDVDKPRAKDGATPLWIAVEGGPQRSKSRYKRLYDPDPRSNNEHAKVVEALIQARCDLDKAVKNNCCHTARADGRSEVVDGATPLWMASCMGQTGVVEALVKAGCDVDKARAEDGASPLWIAAREGWADVVEALIEARGDMDRAVSNGSTPLWIAAEKYCPEVVDVLLKAGCDLNRTVAKDSSKLLQNAVDIRHADLVEALIKANSDTDKAMAEELAILLDGAVCRTHVDHHLVKAGCYCSTMYGRLLRVIEVLLKAGVDTCRVRSIHCPRVRELFLEHLEEQRSKMVALAGGLGPLGAESVVYKLSDDVLKVVWEQVKEKSVAGE